MFYFNRFIAVFGALFISSCASFIDGRKQSIFISTIPVTGANCHLENGVGRYVVESTPNLVVVNRSTRDLHVSCRKEGHPHADLKVESTTKNLAYANFLFGVVSVFGAAVDAETGAAFEYPTHINVPMTASSRTP